MTDIFLYNGAANLNDIILRDPTRIVTGAVGSISSGRKRWWEELHEEYQERWDRERPEIRPSKAKEAVKARQRAKEWALEAFEDGIVPADIAPRLIQLNIAAQNAQKLQEALHYARLVNDFIERLREEDEEESIMLLMS